MDASPDLAARRKAISDSFPEVVKGLRSSIGRKLTVYIASVTDVRTIERWINHSTPHGDIEARLRHAYRVALMLSEYDSNAVVQAWLLRLNPELQDEVPLQLLREGALAHQPLGRECLPDSDQRRHDALFIRWCASQLVKAVLVIKERRHSCSGKPVCPADHARSSSYSVAHHGGYKRGNSFSDELVTAPQHSLSLLSQ